MKLFFSLLVTVLFFSDTITAQTKQEKAVASAVETLRIAMVDGDKAGLEKITATGLSYGHSGGKVESRAAFIENIVNGNTDFVTIDLTGQTIYVSGNTAIVRHVLSATTNDKGKEPVSVRIAVMTVWQKEKKTWKMLARQGVKI